MPITFGTRCKWMAIFYFIFILVVFLALDPNVHPGCICYLAVLQFGRWLWANPLGAPPHRKHLLDLTLCWFLSKKPAFRTASSCFFFFFFFPALPTPYFLSHFQLLTEASGHVKETWFFFSTNMRSFIHSVVWVGFSQYFKALCSGKGYAHKASFVCSEQLVELKTALAIKIQSKKRKAALEIMRAVQNDK